MRKYKTETEVLGTRLFANSTLVYKHLSKVPALADTFIRQTRKDWPEATPEQLRQSLHASLDLKPLEIHDLASLRIEVQQRDFLNDYRCWMYGYLAEAQVPFSGSLLYWKAQLSGATAHNQNLRFGFPGRVGSSAASIRTFLDGKDLSWFEEKVEAELAAARRALNNFGGEMIQLEQRVAALLDQSLERHLERSAKEGEGR